MMVTVYIFKQTKVFNFTKQQGDMIKIQKQKHDMFSQFNTLIALYLFI
jgi:hypothetical protein